MTGFLIGFFTVSLIFLCAFIVLLVLMQRASSNAGMGASLGGGAAESAFGAESSNVLTKWTIYCTVAFFVICFGLYLTHMSKVGKVNNTGAMPAITAPATETSANNTPGSLTEVPSDEN